MRSGIAPGAARRVEPDTAAPCFACTETGSLLYFNESARFLQRKAVPTPTPEKARPGSHLSRDFVLVGGPCRPSRPHGPNYDPKDYAHAQQFRPAAPGFTLIGEPSCPHGPGYNSKNYAHARQFRP